MFQNLLQLRDFCLENPHLCELDLIKFGHLPLIWAKVLIQSRRGVQRAHLRKYLVARGAQFPCLVF